jgi:hypothetical protein
MKYLFLLATLSLGACGIFEEKPDGPEPKPTSSPNRGVFTPGPTTYIGDDGKEHVCNPPGGHCSSDNRCHSSAAKCPIIR